MPVAARRARMQLLLWRTWKSKSRNIVSTLSEIFLPLGFVFLLVWLQTLDKDKDVAARDYTCPRQSAFSPSLLVPKVDKDEDADWDFDKKDKSFLFSVDTNGSGPGIQTVPPFIYVLSLAAKVKSRIALVNAGGPDEMKWLEKFSQDLDRETESLEGPAWRALAAALRIVDVPLCRFRNMVVFFDSEAELDEYTTSPQYGGTESDEAWGSGPCPAAPAPRPGVTSKIKLHAAIALKTIGKTQQPWEYHIRTNFSIVPPTYAEFKLVDPLLRGVDQQWQDQYMMSGFLSMQLTMDRHIIGVVSHDAAAVRDAAERSVCDSLVPMLRTLSQAAPKLKLDEINCLLTFRAMAVGLNLSPLTRLAAMLPNQVRVAPMPTPDYVNRPFFEKIEDVLSLVLFLCYLWPTSRLIREIVNEKETRLRETLSMMGVPRTELILSWFITYALIFGASALLITVTITSSVFNRSDKSLVFVFFFLFGVNVIAFCFLVSVLFDRAKTASTAGVTLFFITYSVFFAVDSPNAPMFWKSASCIFAPTAFGMGTEILGHYERGGEGVHWYNMYDAPSSADLSFGQILGHFLVNLLVYAAAAWYLDQVVPSEFGVSKPWYFLCSPRYWRGERSRATVSGEEESGGEDAELGALLKNDKVEPISPELARLSAENRSIRIRGLRKVFDTPTGEEKVAVHGLNLDMFEGQIFVLLGKNGAGKSTTFSMLTGIAAPTSGKASLLGHDLATDMDSIRHSLGVCPQHDALWDDLTVTEHLLFALRLKNAEARDVQKTVDAQIDQVGLAEKRTALAKSLSGGQKRKLSLAMALIGDSKIVVCDEPTSGMDPYSRRFTWNLLQENRAGRVILLTTHYLDEADELGDRVAIISEGKLACCGSPHFLKSKYGVGYSLTISKSIASAQGGSHSTSSLAVEKAVHDHVPQAKLSSRMGSEISFAVPFSSASSFPALFDYLESNKAAVGVAGFGVSVTTLEEVFIEVASNAPTSAEGSQEGSTPASEDSTSRVVEAGGKLSVAVKSDASLLSHTRALLIKRAQYARRDRRSICCNALLPILSLIIGLGMLLLFPLPEPPALGLHEPKLWGAARDWDLVPVSADTASKDKGFAERLARHVPGYHAPADLPPRNGQGEDYLNDCEGERRGHRDIAYSPIIKSFSRWLLRSKDKLDTMYGAVSFDRADSDYVAATVFANTTAMHSSPAYLNALSRSILDSVSTHTNRTKVSIKVVNQPFKFTNRFRQLVSSFSAFSASISILVAFSFVPASVVVVVVREREIASKHLQILAGSSVAAYWISNFLFDMLMFGIPWIAAIASVQVFGIDAFKDQYLPAVALLFGAYGLAIVPFTYVLSFLFDSHSTAQNVVLLVNFISGLVLMIVALVMSILPQTYELNEVLEYVYRLFPGFCLGNGLMNLTVNATLKIFGDGVFIKAESTYAWDVIGVDVAYLVLESVGYLILAIVIDTKRSDPRFLKQLRDLCCCPCRERRLRRVASSSGPHDASEALAAPLLQRSNSSPRPLESARSHSGRLMDRDVAFEASRVAQTLRDATALLSRAEGDVESDRAEDDVVLLQNVRKVWPGGKVAVEDLSFGVDRGMVFGWLGSNGAGKTTTLKILTGDVLPTSGTAKFIVKTGDKSRKILDLMDDSSEIRRYMGYCPQFESLLDLLTVQEHLELFGRLRGVAETELAGMVDASIQGLRLDEFRHRLAGTLSGGNKRKLSVAIALVGDPQCAVLDEPTTGLDPVSRRFLCDVVASYARRGGSVILVTHSMAEVEALCTRVGVLVQGRLVAVGPIQHLKSRFGRGVVFYAKLRPPTRERVDRAAERIVSDLSGLDESCDPETSLRRACAALGDESRLQSLRSDHETGWIVRLAMSGAALVRGVDPDVLARWWCAEDDLQALEKFAKELLGEHVETVEQRTATCKFRALELEQAPSTGSTLGRIFHRVESAKEELNLAEYSVEGTSLEQIFLSLAEQE